MSLDFLRTWSDRATPVPDKTATQIYLEELSTHLVNVLNARDYTNSDLETYVAPNFSAYMEHAPAPYVKSREEWLQRYKRVREEHPEYGFDVLSMSATVDDEKGVAKTWYLLSIYGHPKGTVRESVTISTWERCKGKWICIRQDGVRELGVG